MPGSGDVAFNNVDCLPSAGQTTANQIGIDFYEQDCYELLRVEILPYFQVELTRHSVMNAGRVHKTLRDEGQFITQNNSSSQSVSIFA